MTSITAIRHPHRHSAYAILLLAMWEIWPPAGAPAEQRSLMCVVSESPICAGDCTQRNRVTAADLAQGIALIFEPSANNCPVTAFDRDESGTVTAAEVTAAVRNAICGCFVHVGRPTATPTPIPLVHVGPPSGGGPGGTVSVPFVLTAGNITAITMDVCFVSDVFDPASVQCSGQFNSATVTGGCDPGLGFGAMTLLIDAGGAVQPPLSAGEFMSCSFGVFSNASPGSYPARLVATLTDTDAQVIHRKLDGSHDGLSGSRRALPI